MIRRQMSDYILCRFWKTSPMPTAMAGSFVLHARATRHSRPSVVLAGAAQRRNRELAARLVVLVQLLGDPEQAFAPVGFFPDIAGRHAGRGPQHDQVIEKVGTLAHERLAAAVERIDDDFERFLAELLGNL